MDVIILNEKINNHRKTNKVNYCAFHNTPALLQEIANCGYIVRAEYGKHGRWTVSAIDGREHNTYYNSVNIAFAISMLWFMTVPEYTTGENRMSRKEVNHLINDFRGTRDVDYAQNGTDHLELVREIIGSGHSFHITPDLERILQLSISEGVGKEQTVITHDANPYYLIARAWLTTVGVRRKRESVRIDRETVLRIRESLRDNKSVDLVEKLNKLL